jgi:hypothetical protein
MLPKNPIRKAIDQPSYGLKWVKNNLPEAAVEGIHTKLNARYPFDHEWDLLIILDACRYDLAISNNPEAWEGPECVWSPGWTSKAWIRRTFTNASKSELCKTSYVTANPFSELVPNKESLYELDEVWRYGFDEEIGAVPPRPVTDRAIQTLRQNDLQRCIVHYMQPHLPPIEGEKRWGFCSDDKRWDRNPWKAVESGNEDPEEVESAYRSNMSEVIKDVQLLLKNAEAERVVITSDHGNFLGEGGQWGHYHQYARHPSIREVPWWKTTAMDTEKYEPSTQKDNTETDRNKQLEALGYK